VIETKAVISLGEVLVDMIARNRELICYDCFFGGSAANVAIHLSRHGFKSFFAGTVGNDWMGGFLKEKFVTNAVDLSLLSESGEYETTIVFVNEFTDPPAFLNYGNASYQYLLTRELEKTIDNAALLHTTARALTKNPMRQTVLKAVDYARTRGKLVSFEPNYRKSLIREDDRILEIILETLSRVDIVKPSLDDASAIFGITDPKEIISRFVEIGVKTVILTCGSRGVYYNDDVGNINHTPVEPRKAVGKTGAGDAFWGGYLSGILNDHSIHESVIMGIKSAGEVIKKRGAIIG